MFITKKFTLSTLSAFLLFGLLRLGFVEAIFDDIEIDKLIDIQVQDQGRSFDLFSETAMKMAFPSDYIPRSCFEFEGDDRCYFSYIPKKCEDNFWQKPRPLVVDVHALSSNPVVAAKLYEWKEIADKECIVMMWPSGEKYSWRAGAWNIQGGLQSEDYGTEGGNNVTTIPCCYNFQFDPTEGPKHPLFLKKAIDHLVAALSKKPESPVVVDETRIYVTGHSNGGVATLALAGLYSDTIAAVAVFAGMLGTPFAENYSGVPIWMVHGTDDDAFLYQGENPFVPPPDPKIILKPIPGMGVWSMDQTVEYLSKQNQCSGKTVTDTTGGTITRFDECKQGASVELLTLDGVGHVPINLPLLGGTELPTTQMAWDFMKLHSKSSNGADNGAKSSTGSEL